MGIFMGVSALFFQELGRARRVSLCLDGFLLVGAKAVMEFGRLIA